MTGEVLFGDSTLLAMHEQVWRYTYTHIDFFKFGSV